MHFNKINKLNIKYNKYIKINNYWYINNNKLINIYIN